MDRNSYLNHFILFIFHKKKRNILNKAVAQNILCATALLSYSFEPNALFSNSSKAIPHRTKACNITPKMVQYAYE